MPEGETVESILETWNSQAGYPVIYVNRNYATGSINISQVTLKPFIKMNTCIWHTFRVDFFCTTPHMT